MPRKVYVGNLPENVRRSEVEDIFTKYGDIDRVDVREREGNAYAFVEFRDSRDADDAVRYRDGYEFAGEKLRVEYSRERRGPGGGRFAPYERDRRGGARSRGKYRVYISGLPPTGSWQDLKDHMREAGDVAYSDVFKGGTGVVAYFRYEDMKYALKKLNETKFRSHENESTYIKVRASPEVSGRHSRSRSASRSPARSDDRRSRDRSRRNRSRSPRDRDRHSSSSKKRERGSPDYSDDNRSKRRRDSDDEDRKSEDERRRKSPSYGSMNGADDDDKEETRRTRDEDDDPKNDTASPSKAANDTNDDDEQEETRDEDEE